MNEMVIMRFPQAAIRAVIIDENSKQLDGGNCWFPDLVSMVKKMIAANPVGKITVCGPADYIEKLIEMIEKVVDCPVEKKEM